jgi:hypothetical protein
MLAQQVGRHKCAARAAAHNCDTQWLGILQVDSGTLSFEHNTPDEQLLLTRARRFLASADREALYSLAPVENWR